MRGAIVSCGYWKSEPDVAVQVTWSAFACTAQLAMFTRAEQASSIAVAKAAPSQRSNNMHTIAPKIKPRGSSPAHGWERKSPRTSKRSISHRAHASSVPMAGMSGIRDALSTARFEAYRRRPEDSDVECLKRYVWNVALCEALYPPLQYLDTAPQRCACGGHRRVVDRILV